MFNVCTCHHLTTLSATMSNLGEEDAADAAGALYIMSLKLLSFTELIRFLNTMFNVCTCHHLTTLSATMSNLGEEDAADAAGALYIMSLKLLSFEELIRFLYTMFNVCTCHHLTTLSATMSNLYFQKLKNFLFYLSFCAPKNCQDTRKTKRCRIVFGSPCSFGSR
jgi:hypothetical protein